MDYETWKKNYYSWMSECMKEWKKNTKYQDFWNRLLDIITEKYWRYRYRAIWSEDEKPKWDWGLHGPPEEYVSPEIAECYIDTSSGISAFWEIEWMEIDPIIEEENSEEISSDLPAEWVDDTEYLCEQLTSEGIEFSIVNHYIHINTQISPIGRTMLIIDCEMFNREIKYQYFWHPTLAEIFMEKVRSYRIKTIGSDEISQWGWLVIREDFYIESEWHEPVPMWEVEWIEIDPIIEEEVAPDLPTAWVNDTEYLCGKLRSKGADFSIVNKYIRVKIIPKR